MSNETIELDAKLEADVAARKTPPEPAREAGPVSHPRAKFWLLAGTVVAALLAVSAWLHYRNRVSTDDAQVDAHLYPISSSVEGKVIEVLVNDNQKVKAGDVLLRIDPRDPQARVDQARAAVALAESQARAANISVPWSVATTSSDISEAQAEADRARSAYNQAATVDLSYAKANLEKAQATADRARADLERMRPLAAKAEISALQLDSYVAAARVADSELAAEKEKLGQAQKSIEITRSALAAAEARLTQAHANVNQVHVRGADASAAQAAIAQARANLQWAEIQLSNTTICSPADGVVTHRSVEVGQYLKTGQGVMVIVPLEQVYVTANFKETQLAHVHPGQKAEVEVDTYGRTFPGHVDSISGASGAVVSLLPPENATGNFIKVVQRIPVKIVLDPGAVDSTVLRPGMNVIATIFTK